MRQALLLLLLSLSAAACSGQKPTAPTNTPPATESPALSKVWLCCGANGISLNQERQLEVRATYADGSIKDVTNAATAWKSSNPAVATVSSTGLVKGLAAGNFDVTATYQSMEGSWDLYVFVPTNHVGPDELVGYVQERTINNDVAVPLAELEVIGGPDNGRKIQADTGGFFRLGGLHGPGFDLMVRAPAYNSKRFHVGALGVDVSSEMLLTPAPDVISDVLQGAVCWPTRTISTTFTPSVTGFLRITSSWWVSTSRTLHENGTQITSGIFNLQDIPLRAGAKYELRVTGSCDYDPSTTVRMTFLRPR
jgi:hypothetical protein